MQCSFGKWDFKTGRWFDCADIKMSILSGEDQIAAVLRPGYELRCLAIDEALYSWSIPFLLALSFQILS